MNDDEKLVLLVVAVLTGIVGGLAKWSAASSVAADLSVVAAFYIGRFTN